MAEETPPKKKKVTRRGDLYEVSEDGIKRKNRFCPKCGDGVFLAKHADRWSCGKCGYSESMKKEGGDS